ncbi:hypothetical protein K0M31_010742 [Melipona bicolor]|uniref:Uncharacterized protein n=1 Tax=Melipona bicolor TaxID=60889 RepID=A0AA40FKS8_9HYME|nr:hypothetical protein K0M31_010742 [Melipona bicolor]
MSRSQSDIGCDACLDVSQRLVRNLTLVTDSLINGLLRGNWYPSLDVIEDSTLQEVVFYRDRSSDYRSRREQTEDEGPSADCKSVDVGSLNLEEV